MNINAFVVMGNSRRLMCKGEILRRFNGLYGNPLNPDWVERAGLTIQILLIVGGRSGRVF